MRPKLIEFFSIGDAVGRWPANTSGSINKGWLPSIFQRQCHENLLLKGVALVGFVSCFLRHLVLKRRREGKKKMGDLRKKRKRERERRWEESESQYLRWSDHCARVNGECRPTRDKWANGLGRWARPRARTHDATRRAAVAVASSPVAAIIAAGRARFIFVVNICGVRILDYFFCSDDIGCLIVIRRIRRELIIKLIA